MKTILTMMAMVVALHTCAQRTSEEEFLFASVGIKQHREAGADMKRGYTLKQVDGWIEDGCTMTVLAMYREGKAEPCTLTIVGKSTGGHTHYVGVGMAGGEAFDTGTWRQLNKVKKETLDQNLPSQFNYALLRIAMHAYECAK